MTEHWESEEEFLGEMLLSGAAVSIRRDPEDPDELLITWDEPVLREKYPKVHEIMFEEHLKEVEETLLQMVDDGLLAMSFQEKEDGGLEEVFSLTEEGESLADKIRRDKGLDNL